MKPESGRRTFLGAVLAAAAALFAYRFGLAPAPRPATDALPDPPPEATAAPRGWREARHWRKI